MSPEWITTEKDDSVPVTMLLSHYWGISFEQVSDGYRLGFANHREVATLIDQLLPHIKPIQMPADHKEKFIPLIASLFQSNLEKGAPLPKLCFTPNEIIGVSFTHHRDRNAHYVKLRLANPEVAKETFLTLLPVSTRIEGTNSQLYLKRLLIALGMFEPDYINALKGSIFPTDTKEPTFKLNSYDQLYYDKLKAKIDLMLQETSRKKV